MTTQKKLIIKIAIVMILIVGAPILYFLSLGNSPLADEASGTRQIAVVNEDAGAEMLDAPLDFGKEVVPILSAESNYEWSVVSRSAAENGLANQDYDAILYIPSNFSENIMTYEELQPVKAEFKYTVSGQLNTANREKVLREIENAAARVNGKISTLYWSYVSQDLEKVRQEFDNILQKEMEFLETISEYYRPGLESVTYDIENQKGMLENLLSSINSTPFEENVQQTQEFQENLEQFVSYVNQYQEYQMSQQQLLKTLQGENITAVMNLVNGYDPTYSNMKTYLEEQNVKLSENLQALSEQLAKNHQNIANLSDLVVEQRDEIIKLLMEVEGEKLVQYETEVIDLKNKITGSLPIDPTKQVNNGGENEQVNNTKDFVASSKIAALETEREKLLALVQEISSVKEQLAQPEIKSEETVDPEKAMEEATNSSTEAVNSMMNDQLNQLSELINNVDSTIKQLQETQLHQQFEQSQTEGEKEVEENVPSTQEINDSIIREIERKETEIINYELLNNEKKERLEKAFSKAIGSKDSDLLLNYYGALARYESALKTSMSSGSISQELASSVNKILGINEDGNTHLNQLQDGIPTSQEQFATLEEGIQLFFTEYMEDLNTEYDAMSKQLDAVKTSAGHVQESLDMLIAGTPRVSGEALDGNALLSNQQSISQSLQSMSNAMNNITQNQQNIMSVTEELHNKAANVNADTNELTFKWSENVGTTEKYRDDIHDVLENAFVDGQQNGQIYEHLSTPLSVNSLDPTVQENKMPPVIVLVIVLISSLLIGYFCYYFKTNRTNLRIALFSLLNLIVGLIISIYGMDIYPLTGAGAIEWTIFTVLLLTAVSTVIFAGFTIGQLVGWFVNVAVIGFFVTPMLTLLASNIDYEDPMSKVYLSIQYGPESLILPASIILILIIGVAATVPYIVSRMKNRVTNLDEEANYEG
ncbi:hypothetical protein MTP04_04520 [Lysinibacillus sp. PLM2]|nr:hypothetical protein MTP04_04520 [Lysinibacillus sp. PLM2]